MKKKMNYSEAEIEIIGFGNQDIVTASSGADNPWSGPGGDIDPDGWI